LIPNQFACATWAEFMQPEDEERCRRVVLEVRARYCVKRGTRPEDLTPDQLEELISLVANDPRLVDLLLP